MKVEELKEVLLNFPDDYTMEFFVDSKSYSAVPWETSHYRADGRRKFYLFLERDLEDEAEIKKLEDDIEEIKEERK